ncbi:MAG: hypothetical protein ACYSWX_11710 [Planctomycetota bacterium]
MIKRLRSRILTLGLGVVAACTPHEPDEGIGGGSGGPSEETGSVVVDSGGRSGADVEVAEAAPEPVDPFEGWTEERRDEWQRERVERTRKVFQRSLEPLEEAAEAYDEHEELPESSLLFDDQASNQERIDRLLDQAIEALELSGLEDVRRELRSLEDEIASLEERMARDREARISAPRADELNALEDTYTTSYEEYDARIEEARQSIGERRMRVEELKDRFVQELRAIGVDIDREAAESLLASVSGDDFVKLCVVFDNVRLMTEQLQELTEESGERLDVARRYYGLYVVLIRIMDRLQRDFVDTVRNERIPQLGDLADQARENIVDAERNMRTGGDREIGSRNVEANRLTVEVTRMYSEYLRDQAQEIERQNDELQVNLRDAINTYDTVRVSSRVAEILRDSVRDLDALLELQVPKLRGFENRELQEEFSRLTDQLIDLQ